MNDSGAVIVSHYVVAVKPSPATPAPAATLVLLRDRSGGGVEALLIERHRASKFAGGDFVFPGGKVEADDHHARAIEACVGPDATEAARVLGVAAGPDALGYWVGAIREAFEEVGVLLAYHEPNGRFVTTDARFEEYRRACHKDSNAFWAMVTAERLRLATDRLVYFAHWITPEEQPIRFDTRFFATEMPAGQEAVADEGEIVGVRWVTPREAVEAKVRGEMSLRLPTLKNLELFDGASSARAALARLAGRRVSPIRPRVIFEGTTRRVLLPGDPRYF